MRESRRIQEFDIYEGLIWRGAKPVYLLGGDFLAIPKSGRHTELAKELLRFLISREAQAAFVKELSWPAMRVDVVSEAGGFDNITVQVVQVGKDPETVSQSEIVVDSPEGLALMAAEGRAPPAHKQGQLRHTVALPAIRPEDLDEPTVEAPAPKAPSFEPTRDRFKLLLLTLLGAGLLTVFLLYFLVWKK